jgi:hypothetical protein
MINGIFPRGSNNVRIDGVLGWIEEAKEVETTTTQDLVNGATSLDVASVSGFQEKDVIIINGVRRIISRIEGNTFYFETLRLRETILAGATVVTYGRVPSLIERALALIIKSQVEMRLNNTEIPRALIVSEKTDTYSYKLRANGNWGDLLGSREAEQIISNFLPPPYVGFC